MNERVHQRIIDAAPAFYYREHLKIANDKVGPYWCVTTLGNIFVDAFEREEDAIAAAAKINIEAAATQTATIMQRIMAGEIPGVSFNDPSPPPPTSQTLHSYISNDGEGYEIQMECLPIPRLDAFPTFERQSEPPLFIRLFREFRMYRTVKTNHDFVLKITSMVRTQHSDHHAIMRFVVNQCAEFPDA